MAVLWPLARPCRSQGRPCRSYSAAHPCALPACCARLPRILRTPAARPAHACRTPCTRLCSAGPHTPARPLTPAPSAPAPAPARPAPLRQRPARPARSLAQPTARPTPYHGRPAGRIAGPSAVSQRAPGRIVGGDARKACAQPTQLHNTPKSQHKECVTTHLGSSPVLLFLHQNIYIFFFIAHDKYFFFH